MTGTNPTSRYPLLRVISFAVAALAVAFALTGLVAQITVLAWAVALMAVITFAATYYLKKD